MGDIRSRDVFRPNAHERNDFMDYKHRYKRLKTQNTVNIRRCHAGGTQVRVSSQVAPRPFRPQQKSVRSFIQVTSLHTKVTSLHTEVTSQIVFSQLMGAKMHGCFLNCLFHSAQSFSFPQAMLRWLMPSWYFALGDRWPIEF